MARTASSTQDSFDSVSLSGRKYQIGISIKIANDNRTLTNASGTEVEVKQDTKTVLQVHALVVAAQFLVSPILLSDGKPQ